MFQEINPLCRVSKIRFFYLTILKINISLKVSIVNGLRLVTKRVVRFLEKFRVEEGKGLKN